MSYNFFMENTTTPDKVVVYNSTTGKQEFTDKSNIATPTTVTGIKPTGNTIGTVAGVDIKETVTSFGTPIITGKTVTLPYTDETGIVKNVPIDLTTLLVDVKPTNIKLDPITKEIVITNSDGTELRTSAIDLYNLTQVTDGISLIGTGTTADPYKINFATRAMLDAGTDTTHAVNVAELKNQIQTNQYKFGKGLTTVTNSTTTVTGAGGGTTLLEQSTYVATLDYPITTLKDGEQFVIRLDRGNTDLTVFDEGVINPDPTNPDPGLLEPTITYFDNIYRLNISGTGDKKICIRKSSQLLEVVRDDIVRGNNTFTYDKTLDIWLLDTVSKTVIPPDTNSRVTFNNSTNQDLSGVQEAQTSTGTIASNRRLNAILPIRILKLTSLPFTPITSASDEWLLPIQAWNNTDNTGTSQIGTDTIKKINISQLRYLLKTTPKVYYSASTPIIVGETTITHNLGLTAPFAVITEFRDPSTGATSLIRIKPGSKTANSFIVISTIATNIEVTVK
jgi:hypothetical protein